MEASIEIQAVRDEDHLRLLSIFYFISAGLSGLFALFPLLYAVMGLMFLSIPGKLQHAAGNPPPAVFGWVLFGFGIGLTILLLVFAAVKLPAGFACLFSLWPGSVACRSPTALCWEFSALSCLAVLRWPRFSRPPGTTESHGRLSGLNGPRSARPRSPGGQIRRGLWRIPGNTPCTNARLIA